MVQLILKSFIPSPVGLPDVVKVGEVVGIDFILKYVSFDLMPCIPSCVAHTTTDLASL